MTISNGKYEARIHNAQGRFIVLVTYGGVSVPSITAKFYATQKAAERGAAKMLEKATA